jgi:hypothetical protein
MALAGHGGQTDVPQVALCGLAALSTGVQGSQFPLHISLSALVCLLYLECHFEPLAWFVVRNEHRVSRIGRSFETFRVKTSGFISSGGSRERYI